jgi:hypothetical protein
MATIETVTTGASDAAASGPYDHLYVGTGGNITLVTREGSKESPEVTVVFANVPAGMMLWDVDAQYIRASGTTASNLVGWK